eukprot:1326671-Prymnesium_polylepis.2
MRGRDTLRESGLRRGPAVGRWRSDLLWQKWSDPRNAPRLRTSDEPSVQIGLRSALRAVSAERTTKPVCVSEELFVLELQS